MENRQIARANVNLAHRLAVDGHPQTLVLGHLLVARVTLTVEAAAHVPLEIRMVTVVENADVAPMGAASQLEAIEKFI
jgi:hypothetical protein